MMRAVAVLAAMLAVSSAAMAEEAPTAAETAAWIGADADGDGILTPVEFRAFVDAMARSGQSTARTVRFFEVYDIAFSVADTNGDGRVTPDELRRADADYRENSRD